MSRAGVDHVAGDTRSSFSPIFWNRITFQNPAKEHTLSILCDPKHLALTQFPTDAYTNWQWSDLLQQNRAKPMVLDGLPRGIKPIVQFIDDWDTARRLGLIIEAKVGEKGGKILICSIDLQSGLQRGGNADERPVARQLLSSLLSYMNGIHFLTEPEPKFNADGELIPAPLLPELTIEQLHRLLK